LIEEVLGGKELNNQYGCSVEMGYPVSGYFEVLPL
jgi:hypothetical protein